MKYIQKGKEPSSFTAWKAEQLKAELTLIYEEFRGEGKRELHESLLTDQGYICCYCGIRVSQENSHIEHLPSQSFFRSINDPYGAISYQHLLASCGIDEKWRKDKYQKEWTEEEFENLLSCSNRCGIGRKDTPILISPLQTDCEAFFAYDASNGAIEAKENSDQRNAALATIATLNLDAQKLRNLRKAAIDTAIFSLIEGLTEEEIVRLFKGKNPREELIPFCFAIAYILKL
ncbi:retron system putative HNH endonuclease [Phormidesmis priestleyi]